MRIEQKLADMGLELGTPTTPVANYIETVKTGNLLFVAGHIPFLADGSVLHTGKLGRNITEEQGYGPWRFGQSETGGKAVCHGKCRAGFRSAIYRSQRSFRLAG